MKKILIFCGRFLRLVVLLLLLAVFICKGALFEAYLWKDLFIGKLAYNLQSLGGMTDIIFYLGLMIVVGIGILAAIIGLGIFLLMAATDSKHNWGNWRHVFWNCRLFKN